LSGEYAGNTDPRRWREPPTLTAAGKRILFKAWLSERKQLVVSTIAPDGSGLRHLAAGVHPAWSPDGRRILFVSEAASGTWEISTMSASGGDRRCLSCAALSLLPSRSAAA
jgi:Tol biopolymer transport system component